MTRILQTKWIAIAIGVVAYALVTWFSLQPQKQFERAAKALVVPVTTVEAGPSWTFHNPEFSQALIELKNEQEALRTRTAELEAWEARLNSERQEIFAVTQTVARLQAELDKTITRVRDEEASNVRKLAKLYSTMSPAGAARILKEMDDDQLVKVLALMKDAESAPILELLGQTTKEDAKRAALLSNRIRLLLLDTKPPKKT